MRVEERVQVTINYSLDWSKKLKSFISEIFRKNNEKLIIFDQLEYNDGIK